MSCAAELFSSYAEDYFESAKELDWQGLARRQPGMFASLSYGAAGMAFALWYSGYRLKRAELFEEAERWIRAALARQRGSRAFILAPAAAERYKMPPGAFYLGRPGLCFVRALISHSRDDRRGRHRSIKRLCELSSPALARWPELYRGTAGCLTGTAILFDLFGDQRLKDLGTTLARHLYDIAEPDSEGEMGWPGLHDRGLAHGTGGVHLALLLWLGVTGEDPPPALRVSLARYCAAVFDDPIISKDPDLQPKLCGGDAGVAVVAAKAFQVLGDPRFRSLARRALERAFAQPPARYPSLCCGRLGLASACLATARIDPGGPWKDRAEELVLSTLLFDSESWAVGLIGGEAARVCLALDLAMGLSTGPPAFDFFDPR